MRGESYPRPRRLTRSGAVRAVQRQYAREAAAYERRWAGYLQATLEPTLAALSPRPGERVLDVGCGTGLLLGRLGERFGAVDRWGIDLSGEMLRQAREREVGRLALADVHHLPFPDASFEAVATSSSLRHWHDPDRALTEIHRVLRPGGRVVLTDWRADHLPTRVLGFLLRFTDPSHRKTLSVEAAVRLLHRAGFEVRGVNRYGHGWRWGFMTISAVRSRDR